MKTKATKAWVGLIGATVTAVSTAWAAVEASLSDGFTLPDVTSIVASVAALGVTVYGIWRVENKPVV